MITHACTFFARRGQTRTIMRRCFKNCGLCCVAPRRRVKIIKTIPGTKYLVTRKRYSTSGNKDEMTAVYRAATALTAKRADISPTVHARIPNQACALCMALDAYTWKNPRDARVPASL